MSIAASEPGAGGCAPAPRSPHACAHIRDVVPARARSRLPRPRLKLRIACGDGSGERSSALRYLGWYHAGCRLLRKAPVIRREPRCSGALAESGRQDLNLRPPGPQLSRGTSDASVLRPRRPHCPQHLASRKHPAWRRVPPRYHSRARGRWETGTTGTTGTTALAAGPTIRVASRDIAGARSVQASDDCAPVMRARPTPHLGRHRATHHRACRRHPGPPRRGLRRRPARHGAPHPDGATGRHAPVPAVVQLRHRRRGGDRRPLRPLTGRRP